MDVVRRHPYVIGVPISAMAVLWAEVYIFKQDENTRMKLLKFQFVLILEVIMSCLSALVLKFSQKIPSMTGKLRTRTNDPESRLTNNLTYLLLPFYVGGFSGRGLIKRTKQVFRYLYLALFVVLCMMAQVSWLTTLVPLPLEPAPFTYLCWCAFGVLGQYLVMALVL